MTYAASSRAKTNHSNIYVTGLHTRFFSFKDSENLVGTLTVHRSEIYMNDTIEELYKPCKFQVITDFMNLLKN